MFKIMQGSRLWFCFRFFGEKYGCDEDLNSVIYEIIDVTSNVEYISHVNSIINIRVEKISTAGAPLI